MNRLLITHPVRMFEEVCRAMDNMVTHTRHEDLDFPVDIKEKDDCIVVRADVPGMSREDLKVTLEDGVLVITGERKREESGEGESYLCRERSYGTYSRSFRCPSVNDQSINASLQNGVLQIILKRPEETKPRKIEIS